MTSSESGIRPLNRSGEGEHVEDGWLAVRNVDEEEKKDEDHSDDDEEEVESAPIVKPKNPSDPTPQEREQHNATHRPFRPWCPICVKARGKEDPHYKKTKEDKKGGLPRVCFDYATIGEDKDAAAKTMIIGRDDWTKLTFAIPVMCKGCGDANVIDRVTKAMDETGQTRMILKGDGEPALAQVQEAIEEKRSHETVVQNPPAYDPQSNGAAERTVQEVKGQIRSMKLGLEARIGKAAHQGVPIMDWIIVHSAGVIKRFLEGVDRKSVV